jgi:hypothetical protein
LLTADKKVVKGLARIATPTIDVDKIGGYPAILKKYGTSGFTVTIETRTITVIPVQ